MTPEEQSKMEQSLAAIGDNMPSYWWRVYSNLKEQGFTEDQAFRMILAIAASTMGGVVKL